MFMMFADTMECPLSKEELLVMVEEEARLRVSAGFLKEVVATCISQLHFPAASSRGDNATFVCVSLSGGD